mgnify:CR=1 FL=1
MIEKNERNQQQVVSCQSDTSQSPAACSINARASTCYAIMLCYAMLYYTMLGGGGVHTSWMPVRMLPFALCSVPQLDQPIPAACGNPARLERMPDGANTRPAIMRLEFFEGFSGLPVPYIQLSLAVAADEELHIGTEAHLAAVASIVMALKQFLT